MTGEELLALARKGRPEVWYELHKDGHTIAAWSESLGRFCAVAMLTITGAWVRLEFEVKVNGKLPYTDADFTE